MNYHIYFNKTTGQKIQTITRATALPSNQEVVCYQELYDDFDFFVISQEEFQDRFTKNLDGLPVFKRREIERRSELPEKTKRIEEKPIDNESSGTNQSSEQNQAAGKPEDKEVMNVILSDFLDEENYANKIDILRRNKEDLDDRTLRNIAICLDLSFDDETDLYDYIMRHLDLRRKYEGGRLR